LPEWVLTLVFTTVLGFVFPVIRGAQPGRRRTQTPIDEIKGSCGGDWLGVATSYPQLRNQFRRPGRHKSKEDEGSRYLPLPFRACPCVAANEVLTTVRRRTTTGPAVCSARTPGSRRYGFKGTCRPVAQTAVIGAATRIQQMALPWRVSKRRFGIYWRCRRIGGAGGLGSKCLFGKCANAFCLLT
jgi:hypothetical protein